MRTDELFHFIKERHAIYLKRQAGQPKPWTRDPILQQYRFCNVYRELDTVTKWIDDNWRTPFHDEPDLWFAMCVARLVNWPETLEELRLPLPWNEARFIKILQKRKAEGKKVFSGAYIVSTNGRTMDKAEYLAKEVLTPLWKARKHMRPIFSEGLQLWHEALMEFQGMGSFMAAQVVCDIKYVADPEQCPDWWTFASSGPGSRRGLNVVMRRDFDAPWKELEWRAALVKLQEITDPYVESLGYPRLHAHDLQNCLCETSKMYKVQTGIGKPRSSYDGIGE